MRGEDIVFSIDIPTSDCMLSSAAVTCQIRSRDAVIAVTKSLERVQLRTGGTECPAESSA